MKRGGEAKRALRAAECQKALSRQRQIPQGGVQDVGGRGGGRRRGCGRLFRRGKGAQVFLHVAPPRYHALFARKIYDAVKMTRFFLALAAGFGAGTGH